MIKEIWTLLTERTGFFAGLLLEHLEISLFAIVIAILAGGLAGILISEFQRTAKPALAVINFLYTIPSISMLGFLIPFSGVCPYYICPASHGEKHTYGNGQCGSGHP